MFNKDEIKNSLTIEQVHQFVSELGGEPLPISNNFFVSKTICHNSIGNGSYKLYYYDNTKLFKCYTDCEDSFDLFELVRKQKTISDNIEWTLYQSIKYVASYFGFVDNQENFNNLNKLKDWNIINKYEELNKLEDNKQIIELKKYNVDILKFLPKPIIIPWEQEGIAREVIKRRNIAYNPVSNGIVIPHYNIDNELIGIRERTLIKNNEYSIKYMPSRINNILFTHPLSFNLYNLNNAKNNIKIIKKAIVVESEKATMQVESFLGQDNDISVAVCGSNLITYQVNLLLSIGVKEIIVAFDKQFQEIGDDEFKRWVKKLKEINSKYSKYVQISFMFDKWNLLGYKDSPTDKGIDIFMKLFESRIIL